MNQFYDAEITKEYVMRGNSAILKCLIPSFVADFVQVVAWINEDGEEFVLEKNYSGGKAADDSSSTSILICPELVLSFPRDLTFNLNLKLPS